MTSDEMTVDPHPRAGPPADAASRPLTDPQPTTGGGIIRHAPARIGPELAARYLWAGRQLIGSTARCITTVYRFGRIPVRAARWQQR